MRRIYSRIEAWWAGPVVRVWYDGDDIHSVYFPDTPGYEAQLRRALREYARVGAA